MFEGGGESRAGVAAEALCAGAGDGGDEVGLEIDAADAVVAGVCDVEAGAVEGKAEGCGELRAGGGAAVAGGAESTGAGDGGDDTGDGIDAADAIVVGVGDEEIAGGVEGDGVGRVKLGAGRGAAIAGEALSAASGDGGEGAGWVEATDGVVTGFGEEEIALGVIGEAERLEERDGPGGTGGGG